MVLKKYTPGFLITLCTLTLLYSSRQAPIKIDVSKLRSPAKQSANSSGNICLLPPIDREVTVCARNILSAPSEDNIDCFNRDGALVLSYKAATGEVIRNRAGLPDGELAKKIADIQAMCTAQLETHRGAIREQQGRGLVRFTP